MEENQLIMGTLGMDKLETTVSLKDLPVAVYTCDAHGYITSYNQAAAELWGRKPEIGKDLWCGSWKIFTLTGEPLPLDNCPMSITLKEGVAVKDAEIIVQRPDGIRKHIRPNPVPKFDINGKLVGAVNTLIDLTPEIAADEKQANLAAIVNSSDDAIISKTLGGIISSWNHAAERMFGYTAEEAVGKHISILIPQDRLQEEDTIIENIAKGIKVEHFETIRIKKDGTEVPISLSVSPIIDSKGRIVGASKIAHDISDRKISDEKQSVLAAIVETSDDAIISKTLQGIITSWNKAAEKTFGYTPEEAIGKHISFLIPPDRLQEEDIIIGNISKGNKIHHFETVRRTKSGEDIHISLSVSPIKDRNGNIIGASKIARDVSALKTALDKTTHYAKNLEVINSLGQEISQNLDVESILQKVTDASTLLTGAQFGAFFYNAFNAHGESYQLYALSGAPREAFEKFGMPLNTAVFNHTFSGLGIVRVDDITKDERYGKNRPHNGTPLGHLPAVSYLAIPVKSNNAKVIGGLFFGHPDPGKFTEEQENMVNVMSSQASIALENAKLYNEVVNLNSRKDEFIGMASHELKTPLTSISGYLQILNRLETTEKSKAFISKTVQQVRKLSALVADLLDISKIEAGKLQLMKRDFDLMTIVEDAIELIQHSQTSHNIILKSDLTTLSVHADPQRVEQLVVNLLTNAVKYSPSADAVEVLVIPDHGSVKVGVRDLGMGIPVEKQKNIFVRFYRVDEINPGISGLGIGLYICKEVVDRHGGKIWVESVPGLGSTFWFTLPLGSML